MERPLILITNDDGIDSPGLAALVAALDRLGDLLIVAPRMQQTSMGRARSQVGENDGRIFARLIQVGEKSWPAFAANATPAIAVEHGLQELAPRPVDLVVSGINYGENVGSCVTVSGTIGAALEAADLGILAIAASLEIAGTLTHEYDESIDFSTAAYFVALIAERILGQELPEDVDLLKIEVPAKATKETSWVITRQDKLPYYQLGVQVPRHPLNGPGYFDHVPQKGQFSAEGTDAYAMAMGLVSVTPLSLDLTSRSGLAGLAKVLERDM